MPVTVRPAFTARRSAPKPIHHLPSDENRGTRMPTSTGPAVAKKVTIRGEEPTQLQPAAIVMARTMPAQIGDQGHVPRLVRSPARASIAGGQRRHVRSLMLQPGAPRSAAGRRNGGNQWVRCGVGAGDGNRNRVEVAYVDQGYTGERAANAAAEHGISLEVVKLPEAKRGFVLLPRRWVVERSFAWATRFRRLVKDYERYPETLAGLNVVAFACLNMKQAAALVAGS